MDRVHPTEMPARVCKAAHPRPSTAALVLTAKHLKQPQTLSTRGGLNKLWAETSLTHATMRKKQVAGKSISDDPLFVNRQTLGNYMS